MENFHFLEPTHKFFKFVPSSLSTPFLLLVLIPPTPKMTLRMRSGLTIVCWTNSSKNIGNIGDMIALVERCVLYFFEKKCLKAPYDYSAPLWTYNFRFAHGRNQKPPFPWFRDFRTCPWAPESILFIFRDTKWLQIIREMKCGNNIVTNPTWMEIRKLEKCKAGPKHPEDTT